MQSSSELKFLISFVEIFMYVISDSLLCQPMKLIVSSIEVPSLIILIAFR